MELKTIKPAKAKSPSTDEIKEEADTKAADQA